MKRLNPKLLCLLILDHGSMSQQRMILMRMKRIPALKQIGQYISTQIRNHFGAGHCQQLCHEGQTTGSEFLIQVVWQGQEAVEDL